MSRRVGHDSNTPWALGGHLPWRVVVVAVWSLLSKVQGKEKASGRHDVGAGTFCSNLFGDVILSCRKCLSASGPKCGGP